MCEKITSKQTRTPSVDVKGRGTCDERKGNKKENRKGYTRNGMRVNMVKLNRWRDGMRWIDG